MARILKRVDANNPTWDLYKVLFRYKDTRQPSRTAKMFIESGGLTHFAERNPQVQVIVKEGGAHPTMTGFYGHRRRFQLDELSSRDIHEKLDYLRNSGGYKPQEHYRLTKRVLKSKQLSVQGMWKGSPELWKDPVRSTESHKADERKMRALFRKINFELGASGTLKVLRKIRATQTEQLNKMQQAQKIKMVRMNIQSLEAYYSKGYVSEFLEGERQNRIRVGAPVRALAGASSADGKGSLDDGAGEEDGDDKDADEEEEEEELEDAGYDAGDLDDDEDDDLEDDEAEEEDEDESDDASTSSSEDEDDDEFEADVDEVLGEDEYISDEELAKINLDDIWAEELGDDDDWEDEGEGPDPDVPDRGEPNPNPNPNPT